MDLKKMIEAGFVVLLGAFLFLSGSSTNPAMMEAEQVNPVTIT